MSLSDEFGTSGHLMAGSGSIALTGYRTRVAISSREGDDPWCGFLAACYKVFGIKRDRRRIVTEEGSRVIADHQMAVIYDEEHGYQFVIPDPANIEDIPDGGAALIAAAVRLQQDPEFLAELIGWWDERAGEDEEA